MTEARIGMMERGRDTDCDSDSDREADRDWKSRHGGTGIRKQETGMWRQGQVTYIRSASSRTRNCTQSSLTRPLSIRSTRRPGVATIRSAPIEEQ